MTMTTTDTRSADEPSRTAAGAGDTIEEAGLSLDLLMQLALKTLHFAGELTGAELAGRLGLNFSVIEPALDFLKAQHQVEIAGGAMIGRGVVPLPHHRRRAHARGAVPRDEPVRRRGAGAVRAVPALHARFREDGAADRHARPRPRGVLAPGRQPAGARPARPGDQRRPLDVRLRPARQRQDGHLAGDPQAARRRRSPSRTRSRSKGAIIRFFDPVNHEPIDDGDDDQDRSSTSALRHDRRWVRCRRPMVMVGGELTLDALELSYNPTTGFYRAPVQALANGGVLVIDDFGRQQCSPRDLLNRWIVPLESRVDFLTLQSGQKFELPFMVLVVFATNIKPAELVDEAFLRRIHYKVFAESPTVAEFMQIFENCCRERELRVRPGAGRSTCSKTYYEPRKIPLRGCQPRDLIDQVLSLADYRGEPRAADAASCSTPPAPAIRRRARVAGRLRLTMHDDRGSLTARVRAGGARRAATLPGARRGRRRPAPLSVRITSPLGRTGIPGTVRIVAQIQARPGRRAVAGAVLRRRQAAVDDRRRPALRGRVGRRESVRAARDRGRGRRQPRQHGARHGAR